MKIKNTTLIFLFLLLCFKVNYAQKGIDGSQTYSSANTIVNEYTYLTADAVAGTYTLTINNSNLNTHNRFSSGALTTGSLIMIIQMQGASINTTATDSTWGTITNYNNCGNYEFVEVASVPNATTIYLKCSLNNNYTAAGKVQIVRVPRYSLLTINIGGVITSDQWSNPAPGEGTGGVVAVEVQGTTSINGSIDVSGKGFRGGTGHLGSSGTNITSFFSTNSNDGGEKGESIAGYETDYDAFGRYCRGAPANGGGGGNGHNASSGGGANAGNINTWTGNGNPDPNPSYTAAWNLEYSGFANSTSSGGGRGGYGWASNSANPLTQGPGNSAWGGDPRGNHGGKGGRPLDYSTGKIFFGGGGGAAEEDNNIASGGNGGGMVYILSYGVVSGSGSITSNGSNGQDNNCSTGAGDPPSGGGAGGTIILNAASTVSGISLTANGGIGGNQNITNTGAQNESEGAGGGGGGGYIAITAGSPTTSASGGANGTTNSPFVSGFPPNGATSGGAGISNAIYTYNSYGCLSANVIVHNALCNGSCTGVANISIIKGTAPYIYSWSPVGGATATASGLCAGNYTVTVTDASSAVVTYSLTITQPAVMTVTLSITPDICTMGNGTATAIISGGTAPYIYSWNNGQTQQQTTNLVTGSYTVVVTDVNGCPPETAPAFIPSSLSLVISTSGNKSICSGTTTLLSVTGGTSYAWSTGAVSSSLTVAPVATTTYSVHITGGICSKDTSIMITGYPDPVISISGNNNVCIGNSTALSVTGGSKYLWSNGVTNTVLTINLPTVTKTYTVIVTSSFGCTDSSSISITVNPLPTIVVSPSQTICAGNSAQLSASGANDYLWSNGDTGNNISVQPYNPVTYTVIGTDLNGCSSSASSLITPSPVVITSKNVSINYGDTIVISITTNGTSYSWNPSSTLSCNTCLSTTASPNATTNYVVTVTDNNGCSRLDTITVTVIQKCKDDIFIPNAFSPNLDLINDVLLIETENSDCLQNGIFQIFDRWGNKVFETIDITKGWDGKYKGKLCDPDVFAYRFSATLSGGQTIDKKGNISLLK